jgi:hypothetical protein
MDLVSILAVIAFGTIGVGAIICVLSDMYNCACKHKEVTGDLFINRNSKTMVLMATCEKCNKTIISKLNNKIEGLGE